MSCIKGTQILPVIVMQCTALVVSYHCIIRAQEKYSGTREPIVSAVQGVPRSSLLNINALSMWASDNGMMERLPNTLTAGVKFPQGTTTMIYAGGLVWGGIVHDGQSPQVRAGGQSYSIGTTPGAILRPGIAENPDNSGVRIFRIRRDWSTADLRRDAAEFYGVGISEVTDNQIQSLREQYRKDWSEWPWQKGAPFYDRDGIAGYQSTAGELYDPSGDEPGLAGADQVMWFVANDLNGTLTSRLFGSSPIGLELQVTCWAYAHSPELANVIFQRYRLVYKGTSRTSGTAVIDSMYIGKWADMDIGDFSDDYVGYSLERSMGYGYNAKSIDSKYADYNLVPPVCGYDFLQGPRVSSVRTAAHWDLHSISGYKNLPATVFTYFTQDTRTTDFLFNAYTATRSWWNIFQGYKGQPISPQQCFLDPVSNTCTPFELSGDAQELHGWVDGRTDRAGDRRMFIGSGPFSMTLGDTQEVVIALLGAMGRDNRDGIRVLNGIDDAVQDIFNVNFVQPDPIPVPPLRIVELENRLILDWEKDTAAVNVIERYNSKGFRFETYKVYQFPLPTSQVGDAALFPPFDPYSSPRFLDITKDFVRDHSLVNGQHYYYALTAVVYNPDPSYAVPRLESPIVIREGTPHSPNPGVVYPYETNEVVPGVFDYQGINDAIVRPVYYDPTEPDNHIYKILFHVIPDPSVAIEQKPKWSLIDSTTSDTLIRRITVDAPAQRVVTRGMSMQVLGVPFYVKGVYAVEENGLPTRQLVFNRPDRDSSFLVATAGTSQIDLLKAGNPKDLDDELRFKNDSSWAVFAEDLPRTSRWVRVPFSAWELRISGRDTIYHQVYACVTEAAGDSVWRPRASIPFTIYDTPLRYFYPVTVTSDSFPYQNQYLGGTYDDSAVYRSNATLLKTFFWTVARLKSRYNVVWKAYIADVDNDGRATPPNTIIRFERYHQVNNGDVKLFIPQSVRTNDFNAAMHEVEKINVFPNPYYGMNRAELDRLHRFVTFNHLPYSAVIRIFTLGGDLVKTLRKENDSQFAQWDITNESGLPVAGGLYLAYLQLSDISGRALGEKSLKLMIVPEKQSLEN